MNSLFYLRHHQGIAVIGCVVPESFAAIYMELGDDFIRWLPEIGDMTDLLSDRLKNEMQQEVADFLTNKYLKYFNSLS